MLKPSKYIYLRGGVYYFRMRLPAWYDQAELKFSLKTGDYEIASIRANYLAQQITSNRKEHSFMDDKYINKMLVQFGNAKFKIKPKNLAHELPILLKSLGFPAEVQQELIANPNLQTAMLELLAKPEFKGVTEQLTTPQTQPAAVAAPALALAPPPVLAGPARTAAGRLLPHGVTADWSFSEAMEELEKRRRKKKGLPESGELSPTERAKLGDFEAALRPIRRFVAYLKEHFNVMPRVWEITRAEAKKFASEYARLPRHTRAAAVRDLGWSSLLKLKKDPIETATYNNDMQYMASFWRFLKTEHAVDRADIFDDLFVENRTSFHYEPWSDDDLDKIFSDKIFSGLEMNSTWEYWLPLMLLFTGARVNEICQLEKEDFVNESDQLCVWITDEEGDGESEVNPIIDLVEKTYAKRLKSRGSKRLIPLHDKLIELCLAWFVDQSSPGRLFPDLKPINNKLSHYPSTRFNQVYLPRMGVKSATGRSKKVLYSFRHTVANRLKKAKISLEERGQLLGHSRVDTDKKESEITSGYSGDYAISEMLDIVELLDFEHVLGNVKRFDLKAIQFGRHSKSDPEKKAKYAAAAAKSDKVRKKS